jgi:hypothetical protein
MKLLTRDASFDSLSDGDYRDIFEEVRRMDSGEKALSLDKFCALVGMDLSTKAEWSRWYNRERGYADGKALPRPYRNALRLAMGMPELPPTVADAVAQHTSPDAAVYLVGEGVADRVVLVGADRASVTLYVNGDDTSEVQVPLAPQRGVPSGTRAYRPMYRPVLPPELKAEVEESGESVEELVRYALEMKRREF